MQKHFGNSPFGRYTSVNILKNEGLFNDIDAALTHYYNIFGLTESLEHLISVFFKNGEYEFIFEDDQWSAPESWEILVKFVTVFDWEEIREIRIFVKGQKYVYQKGDFIEQD